MFKRLPATHLTSKSKITAKTKANTPKKKILKSGSADTLVADSNTRPGNSFMKLLNENASIIQIWYRNIKKKSRNVNASESISEPVFVSEKVHVAPDEIPDEIAAMDPEEKRKLERRKKLAEQAKADILKEMLAQTVENKRGISTNDIQLNNDQNTVAQNQLPKEEDLTQTVEAVNSYYSAEIPHFPVVEFKYEDDFDPYDSFEEESPLPPQSVIDSIEEIEAFPSWCIDIDGIEEYIEQMQESVDKNAKDCEDVESAEALSDKAAKAQMKHSMSIIPMSLSVPAAVREANNPEKQNENTLSEKQEYAPQKRQESANKSKTSLQSKSIVNKKNARHTKTEEKNASSAACLDEKNKDEFNQNEHLARNNTNNTFDQVGDRVSRILDFLKSVEEDSSPAVPVKQANFAELLKEQPTGVPETSAAVFEGVKTKMMQLQMEIDSKRKTIEALKQELQRNKEIAKEEMLQHQKSLKSQLSLQRKEYETIVKRHLTFIDKVLVEKEEISKKSVELTEQVKNLDAMYQEKLKTMEESQQRELKQHREMWQAAEKIKRDKWIQEKTKSIKDQTVLGLEPEIQKLIAQHKVQLRQSEEGYRESLAKEKASLIEQHQRQLEQMRDKYISERQKACEEEREFSRQRYMKQLEREEMEFQQQKRKLQAEFSDERARMNEAAKDNLKNEEASRKRALESLRREMEQERTDRDNMLNEQNKKHMVDMNQLREKFQIEKEEWQANYMKKVEVSVRAREKQFKDQLIQQRDAEIEMVIQRLESETGSNNSDATRRYRMDIERIKSETAEEIKQLRDQHSMALDKLLLSQQQVAELQTSLRDTQKEILQLQHSNISKDGLLKKQKQELDRLNGDETSVIAQLKAEHKGEIQAKLQEISQSKQLLSSAEVKLEAANKNYNERLQKIENDKDQTISHVEKQIVQTLKAKDDYIMKLKGQLDETIQRATHLETLIEQQRNELLGSL
ncbi:Centrosomal protein of 131 kDa [Terramyces sp. JEL0728]|nr:Centrosomal protein of 131 kDa [Terramyces sp. JEL0728]